MSEKGEENPKAVEVPEGEGIEERPPEDSDEEEFQALAAVSELTLAIEEASRHSTAREHR